MFLVFNILILSLYFFEHKLNVFQDFLRVNTIIISFYYTVFQLNYLAFWNIEFLKEDILNITLLFVLFWLFLYSSRGQKYLSVIASYMLLFVFLEYLVLLRYFFEDIKIWASILSFLTSILLLWKTQALATNFLLPKELLRIWWLVFSYAFFYFSGVLIFSSSFIYPFLIPAIIISSLWLYDIHRRFQNYISLLFWSMGFLLAMYGIYKILIPDEYLKDYMFYFFFLFSGGLLFINKIYPLSYIHDRYFFQIFSILVNVSWVLYFFFFHEISILALALLFLWESLYFFFSYYNFRNATLRW